MWHWNRPKEEKESFIRMPRCPHCARSLVVRMYKGIPIYVCPQDELLLQSMRAEKPAETSAPESKALAIQPGQVTGPIDIRAMKNGDLMHYHRLMHPSPVDTREVRAIKLKNKARRQH